MLEIIRRDIVEEDNMKNLMFIAPPSAGKGTVAAIFKEKYNMAHISTGDLLRDAVKKGDELGQKIKNMQDQGLLVTDEIVYELLEKRLQEPDCENGYILDGFPRNIEQAKKYDEILKNLNKDLGYVFLLDAPKDLLLKRIIGRRMCSDCGKIYQVLLKGDMTPKQDGICDVCGGKLYQRSDDNEEAFETRYNTYIEKTSPLIEFYKDKGVLYEVDSSKNPDYAVEQIENIINK
ncbi:MAG: adenylate kinase [Bacilli bacterium]